MFNSLEDGLFDTLAAGTALISALGGTAIYDTQAPLDTPTPYLIYSYQGGGDTNFIPRAAIDVTYQVKAVSEDQGEANDIADLVRQRLHDAELTFASPWAAYRCQHTSGFKFLENDGRKQYYHAGGLYRIRADYTG